VTAFSEPGGFEVRVVQSTGVRLLRASVLALGVAGCLLASWLAFQRPDGWILAGLGLLLLWAGWRHSSFGLSWGVLQVDANGLARWQASVAPGSPVLPERWYSSERLVWIRLRSVEGARHDLLIARDAADEETWRRLLGWMTWLGRARKAS
jgi:uncharacterized membrane protein